MSETKFIYRGKIDIRPIGRGVTLLDNNDQDLAESLAKAFIGSIAGSGEFSVEIVVREIKEGDQNIQIGGIWEGVKIDEGDIQETREEMLGLLDEIEVQK